MCYVHTRPHWLRYSGDRSSLCVCLFVIFGFARIRLIKIRVKPLFIRTDGKTFPAPACQYRVPFSPPPIKTTFDNDDSAIFKHEPSLDTHGTSQPPASVRPSGRPAACSTPPGEAERGVRAGRRNRPAFVMGTVGGTGWNNEGPLESEKGDRIGAC